MQIDHFFKQPTYYLGDLLEGMIEIENKEQQQVLLQVSVVLILRYRQQKEERSYALKQDYFADLSLEAYQRKRLAITCKLEKDLLVTSEQASYYIETELETTDGHKWIQSDEIPILPPKPITMLFAALKKIGWEKESILFDGRVQIFRFVSSIPKQSLRFCEFAIVFGDQGVKLLLTFESKNAKIKKEAYLFYRWFEDFQQFMAILRHIFNPIETKLKSTVETHEYERWIRSSTVLGSRFAELEDRGTDQVEEAPPVMDLHDLRLDFFDDDPDED